MGAVFDIVLIGLLFLSLLEGLWKGFFKKTLSLIISVGLFLGIFFAFKQTIVDYVRYSFLFDFTNGAGITVNVSSTMSIKILSIEDLFIVLQNFDGTLSGLFLKMTCQGFCEMIALMFAVLVSYLTGGIITTILYHLVFKFFTPKNSEGKRKPNVVSRLFGGVISTIQCAFLIYLFFAMFAPLSGISEIVPTIYEKLIAVNETLNTPLIKNLFDLSYVLLKFDFSVIVNMLFSISTTLGFNPFEFFKFTVEETQYTLTDALNLISSSIVEVLSNIQNSTGAPSTQPDVTPAPVSYENIKICAEYISHNKLGFNFN